MKMDLSLSYKESFDNCSNNSDTHVVPTVCSCDGSGRGSVVSESASPWSVAHQASLSVQFSRQEYWSGGPFPSPGDFSDPGIKPGSPALQAEFFTI